MYHGGIKHSFKEALWLDAKKENEEQKRSPCIWVHKQKSLKQNIPLSSRLWVNLWNFYMQLWAQLFWQRQSSSTELSKTSFLNESVSPPSPLPCASCGDPGQGGCFLWPQSKSHPHWFPLWLSEQKLQLRVYLGNLGWPLWVSILLQSSWDSKLLLCVIYQDLTECFAEILFLFSNNLSLFFSLKTNWIFLFSLTNFYFLNERYNVI